MVDVFAHHVPLRFQWHGMLVPEVLCRVGGRGGVAAAAAVMASSRPVTTIGWYLTPFTWRGVCWLGFTTTLNLTINRSSAPESDSRRAAPRKRCMIYVAEM